MSVLSNNKHITAEIFASVTKEASPILTDRFLGNEWWNFRKKTFDSPFLKHWVEGGENQHHRQLQSFLRLRKRKKDSRGQPNK